MSRSQATGNLSSKETAEAEFTKLKKYWTLLGHRRKTRVSGGLYEVFPLPFLYRGFKTFMNKKEAQTSTQTNPGYRKMKMIT